MRGLLKAEARRRLDDSAWRLLLGLYWLRQMSNGKLDAIWIWMSLMSGSLIGRRLNQACLKLTKWIIKQPT
jgi:hypothetical protein